MGDPRRKHKKYRRPIKRFEKARIESEDILLKKYGLKNKKELWKAEFKIEKIRRQAKELINKPQQQTQLLNKLKGLGLKVNVIDDILALQKEDLLERRIQTLLVRKGLANTPNQARQLIVHKHVAVNGDIVNIPSFLVPSDLEDKITVIKKFKENKKHDGEQAAKAEG
jgi:small subunit ribosomal protein S4